MIWWQLNVTLWLYPPGYAAVPSGREELGEPVLCAWRCAGESVPQATVCTWVRLWNWAARYTFCPEDAFCYLAAFRHHTGVSGQVSVLQNNSSELCWPAHTSPTIVSMSEMAVPKSGFACLLAALRHTSMRPSWRLCCNQCSWMPVSHGSNGQGFPRTPVTLLLQLTWCSTAPSKQQRFASKEKYLFVTIKIPQIPVKPFLFQTL